ncbi:MAG: hypothetical protein R8F63_06145 [Acidimicrobiales bacterium]|nr:hypothetical protein [Acidimicrobiales bacterium]
MANSESRLGRRYLIDTHIIDAADAASERLWELHDGGWIQLCRSDAMDTELLDRADERHRELLLNRSAEIVEVLGVGVVGHSRVGHMVVGSDEESKDWDELWELMWPNADRSSTSRTNRTRIRDAMHVLTAARYAYDGFVTKDRGVLAASSAVRARFGLWVVSPFDLLPHLERLIGRWDQRRFEDDR